MHTKHTNKPLTLDGADELLKLLQHIKISWTLGNVSTVK